MVRSTLLVTSLLLAGCEMAPTAPPVGSDAASATGSYIVTMKAAPESSAPRMTIERVAAAAGAHPRASFTHVLHGFAAELNAAQVAALRADPRVQSIEPDRPVRLFTTQSYPRSWGLDRIDDSNLPLDSTYVYYRTGANVTAYVLDTGINTSHRDVYGRAGYIPNGTGGNFVPDSYPDASDCHGHGSHVAGTLGGGASGVAKRVRILAGRVVNCTGGGLASYAIAAMDWIAANGVKPAVVNMSLGYGNDPNVRAAAANLVAAGFVVVAAAGNGNPPGSPISACSESPAGEPTVITVGATDSADKEASFSNYGTCVDILAPGVYIVSSNYLSTSGFATMSGTSMAAPHVAGEAAKYLEIAPTATPAQVWHFLESEAVTGTISLRFSSWVAGTPNRFLRAVM